MWQRVQGVGESFGLGVGGVPPVPLGQFDTDLAPARLRADYYDTMLRSLVCAARPALAKDDGRLRVRARNGRLGEALYVHFSATPHRIERSLADVRAAPTDCYFLWRQTGGSPSHVEVGGEQTTLSAGACLIGDADRPFLAQEAQSFGFSLYLLPKRLVDPLLTGPARDRLSRGVAPSPGSPLAALIDGCLAAAPAAEALSPPAAAGVGAVLARLAAIAADEMAARQDPGREAVLVTRQAQILREIDRGFVDPLFGPGAAARAIGVSVRSVHLALEPTGLSFSEHLTRRRLAEARVLLTARGRRTIADVAFACGFNDLSTFYRAFRRAFDASPRDLRTSEEGP